MKSKLSTCPRRRRAMLQAAAVCLVGVFGHSANAAPPVSITSISGTSDSVGVSKGTWNGQPSGAPTRGKYVGFRVIPVANDSKRLITGGASYDWIISGSGFGTTPGSVWLLDGAQKEIAGVTVTKIVSWTDTKVIVRLNASLTFTAHAAAYLWVSQLTTKPPLASSVYFSRKAVPVMNILNTRGYGQCTWYQAQVRATKGMTIASPSAFSTRGNVPSAVGQSDNGYVPQQWDGLAYGTGHVAIITSVPTRTVAADGSVTWTFTLSEMNSDWSETVASSTQNYKLSAKNSAGLRTVVIPIGTKAYATKKATGYWR